MANFIIDPTVFDTTNTEIVSYNTSWAAFNTGPNFWRQIDSGVTPGADDDSPGENEAGGTIKVDILLHPNIGGGFPDANLTGDAQRVTLTGMEHPDALICDNWGHETTTTANSLSAQPTPGTKNENGGTGFHSVWRTPLAAGASTLPESGVDNLFGDLRAFDGLQMRMRIDSASITVGDIAVKLTMNITKSPYAVADNTYYESAQTSILTVGDTSQGGNSDGLVTIVLDFLDFNTLGAGKNANNGTNDDIDGPSNISDEPQVLGAAIPNEDLEFVSSIGFMVRGNGDGNGNNSALGEIIVLSIDIAP